MLAKQYGHVVHHLTSQMTKNSILEFTNLISGTP
jgi:hypothetical protein